MADLETLFVRIETDLSAFKQGMAEARRETKSFGNEVQRTFSGVGKAPDMSPFLKQIAASERAALQSAERIKKAYGNVIRAQEQAASQLVKTYTPSAENQSFVIPSGGKGTSAQSSGASREGTTTRDRVDSGMVGATVGLGIVTLRIILGMTPAGLAIVAATTLAGAFLPDAIDSVTGNESENNKSPEEQLKKLNTVLQLLKNRLEQWTKADFISKKSLENKIEAIAKQRDAILRPLQAAADAAALQQEFFRAVIDLSKCLRELCARLDSLAPLPPSGTGAEGGATVPQRMRFGGAGAGAGGGIIQASYTGDSPFGGGGLALFNEQLEATDWLAGDAGARIAELTERVGGYRAEAGALTRVLRANNVVFDDQVGAVRLLETLMPTLGAELTGVFAEAGTAGRDFDRVAEALGGTLITAFKGAAIEGKSFRRVMLGVIDDLLRLSQSAIGGSGGGSSIFGLLLNSAFGAIGDSLFGGGASTPPIPRRRPSFAPAPPLPFTMEAAKGAAFLRGRSLPEALAQGGVLHNSVVNHPTLFPMAKGYGLMGEAGSDTLSTFG